MTTRLDLDNLRYPPKAIHNCKVVTIPAGPFPKEVEVQLPGTEGERLVVEARGTTPLAIDDIVRIWISDDRSVGWIDGETPSTSGQFSIDSDGDLTLAGDIIPSDGVGLLKRLNIWLDPTTHFVDFSGFTWATYSGFGTPATIDISTYPSIAQIYGSQVRSFAYRAISGSSNQLYGRVATGFNVRSGIRMDDGTVDNFVELFLEESGGLADLKYRYAVGGSVTGPTNIFTGLVPQFYILRLARNGDSVFLHFGVDAPETTHTGVTPVITSWTPTRAGVYHEWVSGTETNPGRSSMFDWMHIT